MNIVASDPSLHCKQMAKIGNSDRLYFGGSKITAEVTEAMKLKDACSVMLSVRVPKTERIRHPQQCKSIKGFIASSSQGSCHIQHSGGEQEPRAQIYSSICKFRTKTGSWQGLIGCRGFLVFTDWPVIIPLIGQSYHLSDWPELPSLLLARVTISGSPASMTQGLFLA